MKLIIDIPEDEYKRMKDESIYSTHTMICAIQNGIPLDDVKAEIEQIIPCDKEALSVKLGVLEIIDKHIGKAESEEE